MKKFIIYTDGASRGNPGPAAASFIIQDKEGTIGAQEGVYLGKATNNEAEYSAVKLAFKKVKETFANNLPAQIEVRTDSQLIASQLAGRYKIKNPRLKVLYFEVKMLESEIGQVTYRYIPREENFLADKLANFTLDQRLPL